MKSLAKIYCLPDSHPNHGGTHGKFCLLVVYYAIGPAITAIVVSTQPNIMTSQAKSIDDQDGQENDKGREIQGHAPEDSHLGLF